MRVREYTWQRRRIKNIYVCCSFVLYTININAVVRLLKLLRKLYIYVHVYVIIYNETMLLTDRECDLPKNNFHFVTLG